MKRIAAFLLTVLMLLSLAACGGNFGEKRDVADLKAAETAEPSDDSGSDKPSDKEKSEKKTASSKTENTKKPVNNDDDYDYDYNEAYQYIVTVNNEYYDSDGYYEYTDSYTYYICGNCGYEGSSCPDYCGGCGAYFYDWDWEDVYNEYYE